MKYVCLIYNDERLWTTLSPEDGKKLNEEYGAYTQSIRTSGHYLSGEPLDPTQSASTVRVRNGKISTTDGLFAETKEQLGGYYLIEATDLNDAIQVAARIPGARTGAIEVRPVMKYTMP